MISFHTGIFALNSSSQCTHFGPCNYHHWKSMTSFCFPSESLSPRVIKSADLDLSEDVAGFSFGGEAVRSLVELWCVVVQVNDCYQQGRFVKLKQEGQHTSQSQLRRRDDLLEGLQGPVILSKQFLFQENVNAKKSLQSPLCWRLVERHHLAQRN